MMGYAPITSTRVFNAMTTPKREVDRIIWAIVLAPLFAMELTSPGDNKPIWIAANHIAAVTKSINVKGDAVVILKDGLRFDVTETAKNVTDQLAALP